MVVGVGRSFRLSDQWRQTGVTWLTPSHVIHHPTSFAAPIERQISRFPVCLQHQNQKRPSSRISVVECSYSPGLSLHSLTPPHLIVPSSLNFKFELGETKLKSVSILLPSTISTLLWEKWEFQQKTWKLQTQSLWKLFSKFQSKRPPKCWNGVSWHLMAISYEDSYCSSTNDLSLISARDLHFPHACIPATFFRGFSICQCKPDLFARIQYRQKAKQQWLSMLQSFSW